MTDITFNDYIPENKTAVALGAFDGVHLGHRAVLERAVAEKKNGLAAGVFTFRTGTVTSKSENSEAVISDGRKLEELLKIGVEYVYSPDFSQLKDLSGEDFVKEILIKKLNMKTAVCGSDFRFAKNAAGDSDTLKKLGEKYGFDVIVVEPLCVDGTTVSSTAIRRLIREGNIKQANKMLGYTFSYDAQVVHGTATGRTWSFPTINQIIPKGRAVPRFGVYCSQVIVDGVRYNGVTNIGVKPTMGVKTEPLAETFIMNYDGDLYGRTLRLELFEFVREEKRFSSFDELKKEIADNTEFVKAYFDMK